MKKNIKIIGTIVGIIAIIIIGVYIYNQIKISNYLSKLTYDIVQESYDNCGDYSKSKYQDIVPENIYSSMNYLLGIDKNERNNIRIVKAYHTTPITLILSGITAKSLYTAEGYYIRENEDHETGGKFSPTVYWKLDDDNVWRVSDFDFPP
mgnify:FL=1|jgi:hypothetical protein